MSLRKFMHPRNKYKKIPDFKELALLYPEFRKVANTTLTGKVRINFKNEDCLRVLTEVLLKHDFGLQVAIPPNKLIPTLPLRLNYVLWIEDLMKHGSFSEMESLEGIDIGTGAVCIYPLLLAKMYKCHITGTEVDETSVDTAINIVQNNNLQDLIKIVKVNPEVILKDVVKENQVYHFTMCNPPFFETKELEITKRPTKKLPPRNAPTGNETELQIEGGERIFVTRMIKESIEIKDKIKIYTTMLGQKSNLLYLIKLIKKHSENLTWTEFCQGHTTRWGIAWSFLPKEIIDLRKAPVIRKGVDFISKLLREGPPEIIFPPKENLSTINDFKLLLQNWTSELKVDIKELNPDDFKGWACKLTAVNDSWSYARRKRRMAQRLNLQPETSNSQNTKEERSTEETNVDINTANKTEIEVVEKDTDETTDSLIKKSESIEYFLVFNLYVEVGAHEEEDNEDTFKITMVYETGSGGKNALETFRQYLINKLGVREYFQKQQSRNKKKTKKAKWDKESKTKLSTEDFEYFDNSMDEDDSEFS